MIKKIIAAIVFIFLLLSSCPGQAAPLTLRINCTIHSPYEAFFAATVAEICRRRGIVFQRCTPPVARSLINVDQGLDDGDGPRIGELSRAFPNIIPVPEPFGEFRFGAFARSKIQINGWADLADLNVAYLHGWKIFEDHVKTARSIVKVADKEILFKLLDKGRTDVVLITELSGNENVNRLNLNGIQFITPPLAVEPTFLYLNKRYKDLAIEFAQTLREMKQDGTYDKLYRKMLSSIAQGE